MWIFNSWFLTVLPCQKQSLHLPRMPTSNLVIKSVVVEGKKVASSVSTGSCRQTPADTCSLLLTPPLQSAVRSTEHTLNTHTLPFNGTNLSEIHWGFLFIEEFTIGLLFLTKATFKVDVLRLYPAPFLFLDSVRVALHDKINACLSYSAAPQFILWLPFRPCFFFVFTPNTLEFFVGH